MENSSTPFALAAGIFGAAAMGTQNAASRLLWSTLTSTTIMTGNVTQLVIDLVDLARGGADPTIAARARRFLGTVVSFGVGAIWGAFAFKAFSFLGLALPIVLVLTMMHKSVSPDV